MSNISLEGRTQSPGFCISVQFLLSYLKSTGKVFVVVRSVRETMVTGGTPKRIGIVISCVITRQDTLG